MRRCQGQTAGEGALARRQLAQQRVAGGNLGRRRLDPRLACQVTHVAHLLVGHQGHDRALVAGSRRATGPVQIGLVLDRRVRVDHEGDIVDVDAAGGDVGRDQGLGRAGMEGVHRAGPGVLGEVAVEFDRRDAGGVELAGQLLGAVLGAGEDDGAARCGDQVEEHRQVLVTLDVQDVVGHRRDRGLLRVGLVGDRMVEEALDEDLDAGVEGGREEHPLTTARGGVEESSDSGQEAEIGHVVGLVEDGDLDLVEADVALTDEVLETTRAGDDDVDALAQGGNLGVLPDPAEDGAAGHPVACEQRLEGLVDLGDELAGGGQDQGARSLGGAPRARGRQACDEGEQEGVGLAGPGAASAQDVAPGEGVRQGGCLDGGGGGDAAVGEDRGQAGGHAERAKGIGGQRVHSSVGRSFCPARGLAAHSASTGQGLTSLGLPLHAAADVGVRRSEGRAVRGRTERTC